MRQLVVRQAPAVVRRAVASLSTNIEEITVGSVLDTPGREFWSVQHDASVFDATKVMVDHKTGSLAVVDATGAVAGIVTERDYLVKVKHQGRDSQNTLVSEIATMGAKLVVVGVNDSLQDCVELMDDKGFRHLPVKDGGDVIGLISIKDVAHALAGHVTQMKDIKREESLPIHDG